MALSMNPDSLINLLIGIIIVAGVLEVAIPQTNTSLGNLASQNSGVPFISFFASNGLIILVIMASVLLGVIAYARGKGRK